MTEDDSAIERSDSGIWEAVVSVPNNASIDQLLFGNELGFNELRIGFRDRIPLFYSGVGPKLARILDQGIIISCDVAEMGKEDNDGFHNFFIPWSQTIYAVQHIST